MRKRDWSSVLTVSGATFWYLSRRGSHMDEARQLGGRCLLVVEDEDVVAADLAAALELLGAEVVGPAGSVEEALTLVENEGGRLDGAVLDINLRNERVYPVADVLAARGGPFVFTTRYDAPGGPR